MTTFQLIGRNSNSFIKNWRFKVGFPSVVWKSSPEQVHNGHYPMLVWQLVLWRAAPLDKGIQCAKIGQGSIETSNASSWSSENRNHFLLEALVNMSLIFLESVSTFAFLVCLALLVVFLSLPFFSWRRAKSRGNYKSQTWKLTLEQPPSPQKTQSISKTSFYKTPN